MKKQEKIKKDYEVPLDLYIDDTEDVFSTNLSTLGLYLIETQQDFGVGFRKWYKEGLANGKLEIKGIGRLTH